MTPRSGILHTGPFRAAVLACLLLIGWAAWAGGIFDDDLGRQVRTSSFYASPSLDVDQAEAERIIGNRRLVVVLLEPGADLREGCQSTSGAAEGNLVLLLSPNGDGYDTYGCAHFPEDDGDNFGKAFVAESVISRGVDQFADAPLDALKVVVVNYDTLVRGGAVPDGSRTVNPPLGRYLAAAAALVAVLAGTAVAYLSAQRAGRTAVRRREQREALGDARSTLSAASAVLAQQIIDLDGHFAALDQPESRLGKGQRRLRRQYWNIVSRYTRLSERIVRADADEHLDVAALTAEAEALSQECHTLAKRRAAAR